MKDLPRSIYSTPGMIGVGDAGLMPEDDNSFGGLQRVYAARTAAINKVRAPCFGMLNVTGRSDAQFRSAFLVVAMFHEPERPDVVALYGFWLLDKSDVEEYYNIKGIMRVDPASRAAWKELDDDACVLDLNWDQVRGLANFEPSVRVVRNGVELPEDSDAIKLGAVLRRHEWKRHGWLRLESIAALTGRATWTAEDLIPCVGAQYRESSPCRL
jgi:hypothetical protein